MDEGLWQTVMSEDGESNTQNNKGTRSRQNSRGVSLSPIERSKSSIVRFEDENDQLDSDKHHTPASLTLAQQQQARSHHLKECTHMLNHSEMDQHLARVNDERKFARMNREMSVSSCNLTESCLRSAYLARELRCVVLAG